METKPKTMRISGTHLDLVNEIIKDQKGTSLVKPKDVDIVHQSIIELYKVLILPKLKEKDYPQVIKDDLN